LKNERETKKPGSGSTWQHDQSSQGESGTRERQAWWSPTKIQRQQPRPKKSTQSRPMILLICIVLSSMAIGFAGGVAYAMRSVRRAIQEADIHSDEKRFMNDTLGIPQ
jgi:hypothetical protein